MLEPGPGLGCCSAYASDDEYANPKLTDANSWAHGGDDSKYDGILNYIQYGFYGSYTHCIAAAIRTQTSLHAFDPDQHSCFCGGS